MTVIEKMLNDSIEHYGISDIRTLELSQQRDKEIVEQQKERYEQWQLNQAK